VKKQEAAAGKNKDNRRAKNKQAEFLRRALSEVEDLIRMMHMDMES